MKDNAYLILNWGFGILFLIAGLDAFFDFFIGGLLFIAVALLLIPPVRDFVYSITNKPLPIWKRGMAIAVLILAFPVVMSHNKTIKSNELENQIAKVNDSVSIRQKNVDYFNQNSSTILNKLNVKFNRGKYDEVLSLSEKYLSSENQELIKIHNSANSRLAMIQETEALDEEVRKLEMAKVSRNSDKIASLRRESETTSSEKELQSREILARLKKIPASEYEKNRTLYAQLVSIYPENEKYKNKLQHYTNQIEKNKNLTQTNESVACSNISRSEINSKSPKWLAQNIKCLSEQERKQFEINMLAEIKKIPSKKVKENLEGYERLAILNPDKSLYSRKVKVYKKELLQISAN